MIYPQVPRFRVWIFLQGHFAATTINMSFRKAAFGSVWRTFRKNFVQRCNFICFKKFLCFPEMFKNKPISWTLREKYSYMQVYCKVFSLILKYIWLSIIKSPLNNYYLPLLFYLEICSHWKYIFSAVSLPFIFLALLHLLERWKSLLVF